jgi:hypothetical protein
VPPPQEEPTPAAKVHESEEAEWEEEDVEEYLEEEEEEEEEEGICSLWLYLRGYVLTIEDEDDYYCDSYDDSLKYGRVAQAERSKPVAKTSPTSALKPSPPATDVHPAVYTGPTIHHGTPVTDRKSAFSITVLSVSLSLCPMTPPLKLQVRLEQYLRLCA